MTSFSYEARNESGDLTSGVISASSVDDAGAILSQRQMFVVKLEPQQAGKYAAFAAAGAANKSKSKSNAHATRAQVAWQMSQLSIMVETGIPISEAIDCLARQATEPKLSALLESVSTSVQEGASLSAAMAMHPSSYPTSLVALIRAGELSGMMAQVLQRCGSYLMNEQAAMKRLRGALMYPLFMFVLCMAVTVFLLTVILPRFEAVFASRGALLPFPTRVLMGLSHSVMGYWYLWLPGCLAVCLAVWIWPRTTRGRIQIDYLVLNVPVLSKVFNALYQSRSFRTFAVLLEAGVPLVDAMEIVGDVSPNVYYRKLWLEVDQRIRHGEPMAGPLLESDLIPESIAQMIDNGDRSGRLGLVFSRLCTFIEAEYDQTLRTATQMIEPVMILVMGALIGFVAASLMLPLFQAGQVMAH